MSRRRRSSSKRSRNTTESTTDMIQSIRNEDRDIDSYRVVDLRSIAEELSIEIPPRTKKADLVDLIRNNIFRQGTEVGDQEGDQEEDQNNALLQTAPHVDNGVGVGIPIGGALRAIPEQPNEPQPDNQQSNNTNSVTPTADGSGRHPDDVAFEQSGGMIVIATCTNVPLKFFEKRKAIFLYRSPIWKQTPCVSCTKEPKIALVLTTTILKKREPRT